MNYIAQLIGKIKVFFSEIKSLNFSSPRLKIISERRSSATNDIEFQIHNYGRLGEPFIKAREIIEDLSLLRSFSEDDQARILFSAGVYKYKIISQSVDSFDNQAIFTVDAQCDKYHYVKNFTAEELRENKELLAKLSDGEKTLLRTAC